MTRRELEQAIAARTGESVSEVRRLGFSIMQPLEEESDSEAAPNVVDWDQADYDRQRCAA